MKLFLFFLISINLLYSSTLNMAISSSPSRVNPILANDSASFEISQWIFNGLFKYDKNANIVGDLAKSYRFKDNTTLIVKLKQNVYWHDGDKFDADDVIFTYKTIISPKIFTSISSSFKVVKSVKKLDLYTVEIKYKKPYFKALELWMSGMLPYHILKNEKNLMTSRFNKEPIGTGSYKLKSFKNSSDIELVAFDKYFEGRPKIDKILYKFIPDSNTIFLMLKQKQLDLGNLNSLQIEKQVNEEFKKEFTIIEQPAFSYTYLGFNLKDKKFKDIRVRKALSLAIDRQEIIDIMSFGHAKVCNGPFLPNTFAYNEKVKLPKQNINKAKKLLNDAGYNESKPLSFELITNSGSSSAKYVAQIIQYQLAKIGVKMDIRVMEWQAFLNTVIAPRKFESILMAWGLSLTPDAYSIWHSDNQVSGGFNFIGYENKEVDRLIKLGASTVDRKELSKIYKKIYELIAYDTPYLFLYILNSITVVNKKIKNIEPSFIGVRHNQKDWIIDGN